MTLDATTIGRLSNKHLLPRGEIMQAIKGIEPIGSLVDSCGERVYPLSTCESALTRLFAGQPRGKTLKSLERTLKISREASLEALQALGLGFCGIDATTPIPHITFKYLLEELQKTGKVSREIVSVVELALRYDVTEVQIVSILNLGFVPLVLRANQLAYRFYDRKASERILKEKLTKRRLEVSKRTGNFRTFGMLATEFHISRVDLFDVTRELFPSKRWGMNAKMSRVYYEAIKSELIEKKYRRRLT